MMGRVRPMAYQMKVRKTPGLIVVHLPDKGGRLLRNEKKQKARPKDVNRA